MTKENNLTWRERMNTLQERTARGTQRYASKDEASEDEKEEQFDEIQRKKDMSY